MKANITIDPRTCIRCGRCVAVCPSRIFARDGEREPIRIEHPEICIGCGHCVDACPTGAVIHDLFPPERVHPVDYSLYPTPEQMMALLEGRRSNRAFTGRPVPQEALERIIRAAALAPTASNLQNVGFTLVTDPETIASVSRYTVEIFAAVRRKAELPLVRTLVRRAAPDAAGYLPLFRRLEEALAQGEDLILRGAKALIFFDTPTKSRFGAADANLAYQNASLMAESLGVSQFYTGFVCSALAQDRRRGLNRLLGVEGRIHAGMALGMPAFRYPKYSDRMERTVRRIP